MPLEFRAPRPVDRLVRQMQPGRLAAGTFTDDTEMALALAESLIAHAGLEPVDLAHRFADWYQAGPDDIGNHTRAVLTAVASGQCWEKATAQVQRQHPHSAGNGSVMRCWPVALARWNDVDRLVEESRLQSRVTHPHVGCIAGSAFVNVMIRELLYGARPREAVMQALRRVELPRGARDAIEKAPGRSRAELDNSGWVRHTLESATWGLC